MISKELVSFIAIRSTRATFFLVLGFTLFIFTEPSVGYGRFSEITNTIINGLMTINLFIWVWAVFWLIPKKHFFIALFALVCSSIGFWFDLGEIRLHERQFYNTFLLFNAIGVSMIVAEGLKLDVIKAGLFGGLMLILGLSFIVKPIGLLTGFKSEHDFVEVEITYHDLEHQIIREKRIKKGYENLGERLEYHENGKLKLYISYDDSEFKPWFEFHNNGEIRLINCYYHKTVRSKRVKALYGANFDDSGLPRQVSSTFGQVLRYHYNGFAFLSGYTYNNVPYGKWYFYSYKDGSVVDSVDHSKKQRHTWDRRNDLKTNRYREKDSSIYKIRYDQKLRDGVRHYKPDSLYDLALALKKKFDQKIKNPN